MTHDRKTVDPEQWRALMALSDDKLLEAWREARRTCQAAQTQPDGLHEAVMWENLIEGAAASRFGVGYHLELYRIKYMSSSPK